MLKVKLAAFSRYISKTNVTFFIYLFFFMLLFLAGLLISLTFLQARQKQIKLL